MADVPVWHLFAYFNADDGSRDEHRYVADWQVEDVLRWARVRGYDNILLTRDDEHPVRYTPGKTPAGISHSDGATRPGDGRQSDDGGHRGAPDVA